MNSLTSSYKKANNNIKKQISMTGKNLMRDKEVIKRAETSEESNSFITIKNHKENFDNHPTVQLINPAKDEHASISKLILEKLSKKISQKFKLNQWKNTDVVISAQAEEQREEAVVLPKIKKIDRFWAKNKSHIL